MPIGTSDGEYFEDRWEYTVRKPVINPDTDPRFMTNDQNVVSPQQVETNQQLDKSETDPSTGLSLPIGLKRVEITGGTIDSGRPPEGSTEPTGEFNSGEGGRVASEVDWTKINQPFGSLKGTSKEDTPVIFKNKNVTITEGDVEQAINVGLSAGPGTMIGIKAKVFDKNALAHAQIMAADGVHPDVIFNKTGIFKGIDGRWRQELDDSVAGFDKDWSFRDPIKTPEPKDPFEQTPFNPHEGSVVAKLDTIIDQPELYKAYPQLKDINVRYDPENPSAHWDTTNNEIVVGENFRADKGTLYHEIQHAVQDIEGFAKGTFPGRAAVDFKLKLQDDILPVVDRLKELYKVGKERTLNEHETTEKAHLTYVITKFNDYIKAATEEARQFYMKSAGETEARNVDTRVLLNEKGRRGIPPWFTEDLSPSQQIAVTDPNIATAYGLKNLKTGRTLK